MHRQINESADYVMYWWDRAADVLTRKASPLRRFGLVTTNSITHSFQRVVVEKHLSAKRPLHLVCAIDDHPWTKVTADAAAVRIAMTVGETGRKAGRLLRIAGESCLDTDEPRLIFDEIVGIVNSNLTIGTDTTKCVELASNEGLCSPGVKLHGSGFIVSMAEARMLGLGRRPGLENHVVEYMNGRDMTSHSRRALVIDMYGLETEEIRSQFPEVYQHLLGSVKIERDSNNRESYRQRWWIFGEPRSEFRPALEILERFIATPVTQKHRFFQFIATSTMPDDALMCIAIESGHIFAILSSSIYRIWFDNNASTLEDRPRFIKSRCFDPFPFPDPPEALRQKLREAGEELDGLRKKVQAEHPDLTLTGLYNVLEKIRVGTPLSDKDEDVKQRGLVLIIKELHDTIDRLTAQAYGWPESLSDEEILERLVALNAERAREEAAGHVRWLRPNYQIPRFGKKVAAKTGELALEDKVVAIDKGLPAFPSGPYEQPLAVEAALLAAGRPMDATEIARAFKGRATAARVKRIGDVLSTLARYGRITPGPDGSYAARKAA